MDKIFTSEQIDERISELSNDLQWYHNTKDNDSMHLDAIRQNTLSTTAKSLGEIISDVMPEQFVQLRIGEVAVMGMKIERGTYGMTHMSHYDIKPGMDLPLIRTDGYYNAFEEKERLRIVSLGGGRMLGLDLRTVAQTLTEEGKFWTGPVK